MIDRTEDGLAPTTWCGIVALGVAAAAFFVHTWVGIAAVAVAGTTFVVGCLRERRTARHR
jgi:hypothetical protein